MYAKIIPQEGNVRPARMAPTVPINMTFNMKSEYVRLGIEKISRRNNE
jgi:hypothetical protein